MTRAPLALRLVWAGLRLNATRLLRFPISTGMDLVASAVHIGMYVVFWKVIVDQVGQVPGWSFGALLIYLGYAELFFAVGAAFWGSATQFGKFISSGRLDTFMIRPVEPRLLIFVASFRVEFLLRALPNLLLLFAWGALATPGFSLWRFVVGIVLVVIAAWTLALVQMAGTCLSFWLGWARALEEFTQGLGFLTHYPLTIFDGPLRFVLTALLPIGIAATEPALLATGASRWPVALGGAALVCAFWIVVCEVIWRQGLNRYASSGG